MEILCVAWFCLAAYVIARGSDGHRSFSTDPCLDPECLPVSGATRQVVVAAEEANAYRAAFTDPMWRHQWYLHDYRKAAGPVLDLNVVPAHRMGYTGRGVRVAVVDTGLDAAHPDLDGRRARYSERLVGWHGTLAAGLIKMAPNNTHCGVGLAYDAKVVDINTGGLADTDSSLAQVLTKGMETVDIYSNSWGPQDDGKTMKLRRLALNAMKIGATIGRQGKGSVYVFAGGNGKEAGDNCGADDMVNSPYAIGVGAATRAGGPTRYGERCSALLAAAYSGDGGAPGGGLVKCDSHPFVPMDAASAGSQSGSMLCAEAVVTSTPVDFGYLLSLERAAFPGPTKKVTTTPGGGCTRDFWGTSATAPVASAIIALALQANPEMTYRDVMHIITMSAEVAPLADNADTWNRNGEGFWVSNDFGFGLLNAKNMVKIAEAWETVPPLRTCTVVVNFDEPRTLNDGVEVEASVINDGCINDPNYKIVSIEQFQLFLKVNYSYRGALEVSITTANGTQIKLMEARTKDSKTSGISSNWGFKSVHAWGEDPYGKWVIRLKLVLCFDNEYSSCENVKKLNGLLSFLNHINEVGRKASGEGSPYSCLALSEGHRTPHHGPGPTAPSGCQMAITFGLKLAYELNFTSIET